MTGKRPPSLFEKGSIGEESLITWFQENGVVFFPIKQSPESFTHIFAKTGKRPDFFVLLQSLATIAVDAKNCALSNGFFTLSRKELQDALAFELNTRIAFWFSFMHIQNNQLTWYWTSALNALSTGHTRINSHTGEEFLAISLRDFVPIRTRQDFGQLLTQEHQPAPRITLAGR